MEILHSVDRANAAHYDESVDFFEQFDSSTFDEQVETDLCWMGFVRNDQTGQLELAAEYIYDIAGDIAGAGRGWGR